MIFVLFGVWYSFRWRAELSNAEAEETFSAPLSPLDCGSVRKEMTAQLAPSNVVTVSPCVQVTSVSERSPRARGTGMDCSSWDHSRRTSPAGTSSSPSPTRWTGWRPSWRRSPARGPPGAWPARTGTAGSLPGTAWVSALSWDTPGTRSALT